MREELALPAGMGIPAVATDAGEARGAGWVEPPRLPVPDLADSCRRYLGLAEVLLEPPALAATRAAVDAFLAGAGPALQDRLLAWDAAADTNYVDEFWRDLYLANRSPLPIEQNVAGGIGVPAHWQDAPLASRAALVALATMEFLDDAKAGRLAQDVENGKPLCMAQYPALAGAVRVPGAAVDQLRAGGSPRHCIVAWRGGFYPLSLIDGAGPDAVLRLAGRMAAILRSSARPPQVGLLTAGRRPDWAAQRARAMAQNSRSLAAIETAAFMLCIDDRPPADAGAQLASWLGGGANRWFDKTLQIVVGDGMLGCNIEHSGVDGFTVARYGQHLARFLARHPVPVVDAAGTVAEPLGWRLDDALAAAIDAAERTVRRENDRLAMRCFEVAGCPGGIRGDLAVQLAIQLAYLTLTGRMDAVYQPVHMRRFKAGRTEAVRPVTGDTLQFCRLTAGGAADAAVAPLARRALRDIKARASQSRQGCGIDRHFFALYNLAARSGTRVGLFEDPAYMRLLGPAILCTSSVAAGGGLDRFAFGPVRPDGFGIAYVTDRAGARFCITGWRDDLDDFCGCVENAVGRVAQLAAARPTGRPGYLAAYLNE